MAKITKRSVDALVAAGPKPTYLWDDALAGFGVKALPSGPKRYVVKYRTQGGRSSSSAEVDHTGDARADNARPSKIDGSTDLGGGR